MKRLFLFVAFLFSLSTITVQAQDNSGGDPQAMLQRMKDRIKPQLMEKTKLTDAQADKVIEINFQERQQMRGLRDMSEDDRKKKMDEIREDLNKQYKAIPLTEDQIRSVNDFFDEMRKNMRQRQQGGGNGGGR